MRKRAEEGEEEWGGSRAVAKGRNRWGLRVAGDRLREDSRWLGRGQREEYGDEGRWGQGREEREGV